MPSTGSRNRSHPLATRRDLHEHYGQNGRLPACYWDNPALALLAGADSSIVSSVTDSFNDWRGNIYRLVVHPGNQRLGIARALIAQVEKRLAQQGARQMTGLVKKDHPRATGFRDAMNYGRDLRMISYVRNLPKKSGSWP